MKKLLKVLCVAIFLTIGVCDVEKVYASGIESRALMEYEMMVTSASGRITVYGSAIVQDSSSTIIDYNIGYVVMGSGVTNATVISSGISSGQKQVYITVGYYYYGSYKVETVYFSI